MQITDAFSNLLLQTSSCRNLIDSSATRSPYLLLHSVIIASELSIAITFALFAPEIIAKDEAPREHPMS